MKNKDIEQIARDLITEKIRLGETVQMEWAVQELISQQGKIEGDAVEFYTLCARNHVYRIVKTIVEKYNDEATEDAERQQMRLKGFEHLNVAYSVERSGERVLVPIDQLTDDELLARAAEFDRQSKALTAHADELRSYVAKRSEGAARAA